MPVTDQAGYGKLRRLPIDVSHAFLVGCSLQLAELFPDEITSPMPECLMDWQVFGVDGKKLKKLAKRLKPARGVDGKLLGGKTLVARDLHLGVAVAMQAHLDGEANDGPLVPGLLEQIVEEDPDTRHAEPRGEAELALEGRRVEGLLPPHLEGVRRGAWREVAADPPAALREPHARSFIRRSHAIHVVFAGA